MGARILNRRVSRWGDRERSEELTFTAQSVRMIYIERDGIGTETLRTESRWSLKATPKLSAIDDEERRKEREAKRREVEAKRRSKGR